MKIVFVSDSPKIPTGFGHQAQLLGDYFVSQGHQCHYLTYNLGNCGREGYDITLLNDINDSFEVESEIRNLQPDAVIVLAGSWTTVKLFEMNEVMHNCPVYYWWAFEGVSTDNYSQYANTYGKSLRPNSVIHMSKFAADLWKDIFPTNRVAYHMADPEFAFTKYDHNEVAELREKWSDKLKVDLRPEDYIFVNVNANYWRKHWDLALQALAGLGYDNVRYLGRCHDRVTPDSFNVSRAVKTFGVEDKFTLIPQSLPKEDLIELYKLSDATLNLTAGEGFGVSYLESRLIGLPQVVPALGVFMEIDPQGTFVPIDHLSYRHNSYYQIVSVEETLNRMYTMVQHLQRTRTPLWNDRRFRIESVGPKWLSFIEKDVNGFVKGSVQSIRTLDNSVAPANQILELGKGIVCYDTGPLTEALKVQDYSVTQTKQLGSVTGEVLVLTDFRSKPSDERRRILKQASRFSWVVLVYNNVQDWDDPAEPLQTTFNMFVPRYDLQKYADVKVFCKDFRNPRYDL